MSSTTFGTLGVPAPLVAALAADGKTEPFPIQLDTLPDTLAGRDGAERPEPGTPGLMLAMGPGFCAELVLLQW